MRFLSGYLFISFLSFFYAPAFADHFPVQLEDFEVLDIQVSGKIEWQSAPASGSVDCSASLFSELEFDQSGKNLILSWKNNGRPEWKSGTEKLTIRLSSELLRKVVISGSADFHIKGVNKSPEFNLNISGSGDCKGSIDCSGNAILNISGSGDAELSGHCRSLEIRITGSGEVEAKDLKSEVVRVRIAGSGDADVFALKELDAAITGSGNVSYWGNPEKLAKEINGSGTIKKGQ